MDGLAKVKRKVTMSSEIDISSIFDDPELYVKSVDWSTGAVSIVQMTRETYRASNFLDKRVVSVGSEISIKLEQLLEVYRHVKPVNRPIRFIFHTAFCGSTLLSRCLEETGNFLSYREPLALHQLAFARRKKTLPYDDKEYSELTKLLLALYGRTYEEGTTPLVKPSDSCINVAHDLLNVSNVGGESSALLLYAPLPDFVVTMLKIPSRRKFVRSMFHRAQMDLKPFEIMTGEQLKLNDAQVAAVVWLGLILPYLSLLKDKSLNVRSLESRIFYQNPEQTLTSICDWFGHPTSPEILEEIVNNGVFTRQAKNTANKFDRERKAAEKMAYHEALLPEIEIAKKFVSRVASGYSIPEVLPESLEIGVNFFE